MNKSRIIMAAVVILAVGSLFAAMTMKSDQDQPARENSPDTHAMMHEVMPDQGQPGEKPVVEKTPPEAKPEADSEKGAKVGGKPSPPKTSDAKKPAKPGKNAGQRPNKHPGPGGNPALAEHRHTFQLMRMFMVVSIVEMTGQNALTPAQARQVLDILKPLRSKPKLTQADAEKAANRLKKVLTADQLKVMENMRSNSRAGQKPGGQGRIMPPGMPGHRPPQGALPPGQNGMRREGPPPGGSSGAPGERRVMRKLDPEAMKDYNPFYSKPPKGNEMLEMQARRMNEFFAGLEKKAK